MSGLIITILSVVFFVIWPAACAFQCFKGKEYLWGLIMTFLTYVFGIYVWDSIRVKYGLCETTTRMTTCCIEYDYDRAGSYCIDAEPCRVKVCINE